MRSAVFVILAFVLGLLMGRLLSPAEPDRKGLRVDPLQERIAGRLDAIEAVLRSITDAGAGTQKATAPDTSRKLPSAPVVIEGNPGSVASVLRVISAHESAAEKRWWEATLGETRRQLESRPTETRTPFERGQIDDIGRALSDLVAVDGQGELAAWKTRYKLLFSNLVVAGSSVWTDWATTWGRVPQDRDG